MVGLSLLVLALAAEKMEDIRAKKKRGFPGGKLVAAWKYENWAAFGTGFARETFVFTGKHIISWVVDPQPFAW